MWCGGGVRACVCVCVCVFGDGGELCVWVGGGGGYYAIVYVYSVLKCEVYCMHFMSLLNCLYVTATLSRIPGCDCCLSVNYYYY